MITQSDYNYIKHEADKREAFHFEKSSKEKNVIINGCKALANFYSGKTKENDYILGIQINNNTSGRGCPIEQHEFDSLIGSYQNFCDYLEKLGVEVERETQLSLFD
jgi:hypothetical protein